MGMQPVHVVLWEMSKLAKGTILRSVVLPTALYASATRIMNKFMLSNNMCTKWNLKDQIYRLRHKWRGIFKKTETRVIHDIETRRMHEMSTWAGRVLWCHHKVPPTSQLHGFLVEEKELKSLPKHTCRWTILIDHVAQDVGQKSQTEKACHPKF